MNCFEGMQSINTLLRLAMHELLFNLHGQHELFEMYAMDE